MRAEIAEQPAAIARTLDALLPQVPEVRRLAADTRHVLLIARGSSDNAAVYGRYLVEIHAGRMAALAAPSVATVYHSAVDLSGVLAVALSQSGRTEEIVETLQWARDGGARTIAITNEDNVPLSDTADVTLMTRAGVERAVPATKTYTTALAALAVLALGLREDQGMRADLARVPSAVQDVLATAEPAEALSGRLAGATSMVVSGRGYAYSTALELAIKLKETCYLGATGLSYADLLHGPIAAVGEETPALLVAADSGPVLPGVVALAVRLRAAGVPTYAIGGGAALAAVCDALLPGTALPEKLAPLALVVPGQLLVEALARRLGIDADAPRGLRKVTQTDN